MAKDDKYKQETDELKEEIKLLKQSKKQEHDPKTRMYRETTPIWNKKTRTQSLSLMGTNKKISQ